MNAHHKQSNDKDSKEPAMLSEDDVWKYHNKNWRAENDGSSVSHGQPLECDEDASNRQAAYDPLQVN